MESTKTLLFLFLTLALAMRFQESSAQAEGNTSEEEDSIVPDEEALIAYRRALPYCSDIYSRAFCKRFRRFCRGRNSNGFLMRAKCDFSCGCMR